MLKADEFVPRAPARARPAKPVPLLSRSDDPEEQQPTDSNGHVVPDITPFVVADANGDVVTAKGGLPMPRGVYDRSKATKRTKKDDATAEAAPAARKPRRKKRASTARRAAAPPRRPRQTREASDTRFGAYSDGTVVIDAPKCKGELDGEQVELLYQYVRRLRGE